MLPQTKGKMFLSDERGINQGSSFRTLSTFNNSRFYNVYKTPFGALQLFNEETLAGSASNVMTVADDTEIFILPVVGSVEYRPAGGGMSIVTAGECLLFSAPAGYSYTVYNPYESELVSFLQIWLKKSNNPATAAAGLFSFDLDNNRNRFINIIEEPTIQQENTPILIGKFTGRNEAAYSVAKPGNGLFFYVIEGAFEVQNRLLHAGDGLALWDVSEAELEALSNDAIILLLEIPGL